MFQENENVEAIETTDALEVVKGTLSTQLSEQTVKMLLDNVDKLEDAGPGIQLDSESYQFKTIGETVKGVFVGHLTMQFKVENFDIKNPQYVTQDAIRWMNKDTSGKVKSYVCASKALVNKIKENGIPVGALLEITMTDDKGGNNKKVKLFDVSVLNAAK